MILRRHSWALLFRYPWSDVFDVVDQGGRSMNGLLFLAGPLIGEKGPAGPVIPLIDRTVKISMRVVTMDVPSQEVITGTTLLPMLTRWSITGLLTNKVSSMSKITALLHWPRTTLQRYRSGELDELLSERSEPAYSEDPR